MTNRQSDGDGEFALRNRIFELFRVIGVASVIHCLRVNERQLVQKMLQKNTPKLLRINDESALMT